MPVLFCLESSSISPRSPPLCQKRGHSISSLSCKIYTSVFSKESFKNKHEKKSKTSHVTCSKPNKEFKFFPHILFSQDCRKIKKAKVTDYLSFFIFVVAAHLSAHILGMEGILASLVCHTNTLDIKYHAVAQYCHSWYQQLVCSTASRGNLLQPKLNHLQLLCFS